MRLKGLRICCLSMAVLVTLFSAMCFINPSIAHDDNSVSWNGLFNTNNESKEIISSDLLSADNQTVLINNYSKEYSIPIKIVSSKDVSDASITATSENAELLTASLSNDKLDMKAGQEQTVNLNMTVVQSLADITSNVSNMLSSSTEEDTESNGTDTGEKTNVIVNVVLTYENEKVSANIRVPITNEVDTNISSGVLANIQTKYNKQLPITIVSGNEETTLQFNNGAFPAKTKYIIDGKTTLLYDGGVIQLAAQKSLILDLSETDISGEIDINSHKLSEQDLVLNIENKSFIIKNELELPISYLWGTLEPSIKIEHLTVNEDQLIWTENKLLTYEKSSAGNILLKNTSAEAGTYRITVSWIENDITLYKIEVPFFVRYDSAALGGTGQ